MRETLKLYVRKGAHDESCILSFKRPPNISLADVLQAGLVMDGDSVVCTIDGEYDDEEGWTYPLPPIPGSRWDVVVPFRASTLPDAVEETMKALAAWLEGYGYDVEFEQENHS